MGEDGGIKAVDLYRPVDAEIAAFKSVEVFPSGLNQRFDPTEYTDFQYIEVEEQSLEKLSFSDKSCGIYPILIVLQVDGKLTFPASFEIRRLTQPVW